MSCSRVARSTVGAILGVAVLALSTGACSVLGFGGPAYNLNGAWSGSVTAEGERIPGTLTVRQEARALTVTFAAPEFGLSAAGTGEVADDGEVWMELDYNMECPGVARLEGSVSEDRSSLRGTLEATDCTGTVDGTFRFRR